MNVDAMIKHHQAVTEVITHAMSDYASAATGTSWNNACFAFEADAILCALSRAGFRILGPDEVDPVTVERCVDVAAATDTEKPANWLHRREDIAAAIRALSSPDHADAGKVEGDGRQELEQAARNLIANRFDTYKARNGKLCSIEGDDGEKCWIVSFDDMAELEAALPAAPASEGAE